MAEPEIRYCTTTDGVSIAYYRMGEGPPLVITSFVIWSYLLGESPQWPPEYYRAGAGVGRGHAVVRYDSRGTGLSDQSALDFSLDARVRDLEAVVDHLDLPPFALLGSGHGAVAAIAYAVRHPSRVTNLILVNGYTDGGAFARAGARWQSFREEVADDWWESYTLTMANANLHYRHAEEARRWRSSTGDR